MSDKRLNERKILMNRQIVAFLSLFSLVLVLSIYYVMLPFSQPVTSDSNVNVNIEDSAELYFASLLEQREDSYVAYIGEQTAIVASSTATNIEKAAALEAIETKRALQQKEDDTINLLVDAGFAAAYVELASDGTVQIILDKEAPTKADIAHAIAISLTQFGYSHLPQVSFYQT